jgi:tRNA dimethylallyltransferase
MKSKKEILCIFGPTASGKSSYAIERALSQNFVIINIDSAQVYKNVEILSASPSIEDKETVPHKLYNFLNINEKFSVYKYIQHALDEIKLHDKIIFVGGTGLYIESLFFGINKSEDIKEEFILQATNIRESIGKEKFYEDLILKDASCINLHFNDTTRTIRSYAFFLQYNKSINLNKNAQKLEFLSKDEYDISYYYVNQNRDIVYKNCEERLNLMLKNGAIEEAKFLIDNHLEDYANKIIGAFELIMYLKNQLSLNDARSIILQKTRNYAKRQYTWFNNRLNNRL